MKYHMVFKFLALLLCACCLLVSIGAGIGIFALVEGDLYNTDVAQLRAEYEEGNLRSAAYRVTQKYAIEKLSDLPQEAVLPYVADYYGGNDFWVDAYKLYYTIADETGNIVSYYGDKEETAGAREYTRELFVSYPVVLAYRKLNAEEAWKISEGMTDPTLEPSYPGNTIPQETQPPDTFIPDTVEPPKEDSEYLYIENWAYGPYQYRLGICKSPTYTVTLYFTEDTFPQNDVWLWQLVEFGYANRYNIIWVLGAALLLFAAMLTYLCCVAGRKPKCEEVCPGGLNRLPLDLYAVCIGVAVVLLVAGGIELIRWSWDYYDPWWLLALLVCAMALLACLLVVAVLFGCAAQFKMKNFYWAKHSVTGMVLMGIFRILVWSFRKLRKGIAWIRGKLPLACRKGVGLLKRLFEFIVDLISLIWKLFVQAIKTVLSFLKKVLLCIWKGIVRLSQLLPLTWQWLLVGLAMIFVLLISFGTRNTGIQFLGIAFCICIVMYGAHCFGILLENTRRMSQGDLDTKVEDKLLLGSFREYASHLNTLADAAVEAARKQMKSERMKAELVTNVSHDIKTPLTSIINYVDLLQKAESEEEKEEYLEVLDRQSQRLKKLIEDLMEMSKASTGNMAVDLGQVNAVEAVNQALGEFSEKLEKAQLIPVFTPPEEPVMMVADGRLTWRVLSNLLSNTVKYAMPGTRLYIDLVTVNGQVLISLKNISKEQLNVSTEELMERFVRGDASRNTEGSGLGLNIAKSLMELQKGQLQLLVDGDLFKATLLFPQH